ncbi:MAG: nucleotidyl transferase AbiEii/AbiGii toxin family protein [Propionibacteriaceae bacterium]|jgi:predicted nucleotidyltransferase component of viral defense system|nr:nucleotidyl transferase AbiEii/AbiGii toxin family protein [Propionibacteriaceae bacterium]
MLSINDIAAWGITHPWASAEQVEQDLLLSRAICAIASHDYLGQELVFRGGTALHKLHLPRPLRYSEDLDYVRSTGGGIGQLTGALLDLGRDLGFDVRSKITEHPKVYWRTTSQAGTPLRIKVEVNTHERSPALPLINQPYQVESPWWTGQAEVQTFKLAELIATKIRALYQRSKGRDLFDMWLTLTATDLDPADVLAAFDPYRPARYTSKAAVANLQAKLAAPDFRHDLDELAAQPPVPYSPDEAAALVTELLLNKV